MKTVDVTEEFFAALGKRAHEPLLRKVSARMRFDLVAGRKTQHWLLTVDGGDIAVERRHGEADCVLRADKAVFDDVAAGRVNAFAALLRGALDVEGDVQLLVLFQRLLPSPRRSRARRTTTRAARR
jgi:putative sterol carrier protein